MNDEALNLAQAEVHAYERGSTSCCDRQDSYKLAAAYIDLNERMQKIAEEAETGLRNYREYESPHSNLTRILALTKGQTK